MAQGAQVLDTILLLALPASGKSEVRRYLAQLSPTECRDDFHMGPTLQLDDFPYVHMMRRIDDELSRQGKGRFYFNSPEQPFQNPRNWGTLIALINEDYQDLVQHNKHSPKSAALHLMERIDAAAKSVGAPAVLPTIDTATRDAVASTLENEAVEMLKEKNELCAQDTNGKTVVIEFARGGKHDSSLPLPVPFGYEYSLGVLSDDLLKKASILYIWVTPEESRRKNFERTNPNDPGSILNHGVPIDVMMNDYGCDDMNWLEEHSDKQGTVTVKKGGHVYHLPIARFDNRTDKTTFIRNDRKQWKPEQVKTVHEGLKNALTKLAQFKR